MVPTVRCASDTARDATSVDFTACAAISSIEAASSSTELAAAVTSPDAAPTRRSAVCASADMVSAAFRSTILQQAASDDVRGRLQGVFIVVVAGGPRLADATHGVAAAVVGTTIAAAGGGALVVVGVLIAALAVPAFIRYRVTNRSDLEDQA